MTKRLWKPCPARPELLRLLAESVERVRKMTPAELDEMIRQQRESWARQDMD